jgi:hypothetical protein
MRAKLILILKLKNKKYVVIHYRDNTYYFVAPGNCHNLHYGRFYSCLDCSGYNFSINKTY